MDLEFLAFRSQNRKYKNTFYPQIPKYQYIRKIDKIQSFLFFIQADCIKNVTS